MARALGKEAKASHQRLFVVVNGSKAGAAMAAPADSLTTDMLARVQETCSGQRTSDRMNRHNSRQPVTRLPIQDMRQSRDPAEA